MVELDRYFVFTQSGIKSFMESTGLILDTKSRRQITDCYLDCNTILRREINDDEKCFLITNTGNECPANSVIIDSRTIDRLSHKSQLNIHRARYDLISRVNRNMREVEVDFIETPMKLAFVRIKNHETSNSNLSQAFFDRSLIECSLSPWKFFKRKIGICGGPSCGKTETAKSLSHIINTEFSGNSFHVAEFATTFIQKYKRHPKLADQFFIWFGQRQRETDASAADIVISDCPTFMTYLYTLITNKSEFSEDIALYLSKIYKRVLFELQEYSDIIFLKIKQYKENNIRFQTPAEALLIENRIELFLKEHMVPHTSGDYSALQDIFNKIFYINSGD